MPNEISVETAKAKMLQLEENIRLLIERYENETGASVDNLYISSMKKGKPDRVKATVTISLESDYTCQLCGEPSRNGSEHSYCTTVENNREDGYSATMYER